MPDRHFGEIEGVPEGTDFQTREALSTAEVHRPTQAGISGGENEGSDSIVLSGGYEDDEDFGDVIVYTGHGGRDPGTGQQIANQTFARGNAALARNKVLGLPVRVVRGFELDSPFAPERGYRYDGLYSVDEFWEETGRSGFKVWRYRLRKDSAGTTPAVRPGAETPTPPERRQVTTTRIIRDTEKSRRVKQRYDYTCQICGTRLDTPAGPYAEGAHIKPLGVPHNGPDIESNILCLCPNHHALFDDGAIALADDFTLIGANPQRTLEHLLSNTRLESNTCAITGSTLECSFRVIRKVWTQFHRPAWSESCSFLTSRSHQNRLWKCNDLQPLR
jgi:putative restriction endonuclease